jgi:hypothetical protein
MGKNPEPGSGMNLGSYFKEFRISFLAKKADPDK